MVSAWPGPLSARPAEPSAGVCDGREVFALGTSERHRTGVDLSQIGRQFPFFGAHCHTLPWIKLECIRLERPHGQAWRSSHFAPASEAIRVPLAASRVPGS
jgi:hypothetical protein